MNRSFLVHISRNFERFALASQMLGLGLITAVIVYFVHSALADRTRDYAIQVEIQLNQKLNEMNNSADVLAEAARKVIRLDRWGKPVEFSALTYEQFLFSFVHVQNESLASMVLNLPHRPPSFVHSAEVFRRAQDLSIFESNLMRNGVESNRSYLIEMPGELMFKVRRQINLFSTFGGASSASTVTAQFADLYLFYRVDALKRILADVLGQNDTRTYQANLSMISQSGQRILDVGSKDINWASIYHRRSLLFNSTDEIYVDINVGRRHGVLEIVLLMICSLIFLTTSFWTIRKVIQNRLTGWMEPFNRLYSDINALEDCNYLSSLSIEGPLEIRRIRRNFEYLRRHMLDLAADKARFAHDSAQYQLSRQVAHDIRSPMSALGIAASNLAGLSKDRSDLIMNAIDRINGIVDSLEPRTPVGPTIEGFLINLALSNLIREKGLEYPALRIDLREVGDPPGRMSVLGKSDFLRIVSNLINNAFEAGGRVIDVVVSFESNLLRLTIRDDGKGIPPHIRSESGQRLITTKTYGQGRGLWQAFDKIKGCGGQLVVESSVSHGAKITMTLPLT